MKVCAPSVLRKNGWIKATGESSRCKRRAFSLKTPTKKEDVFELKFFELDQDVSSRN